MMWLLYATGTREFSLSSSDDFSWWLDVGIGAVSPVKQSSDRRRQAQPVRLGAIDDRVRAAEWPDTMRLRQVLASYTAFLAGVGFSHTFNAALVRARPKRSTLASASLCRRARASFRSSGGRVGLRNRATRQPSPLLFLFFLRDVSFASTDAPCYLTAAVLHAGLQNISLPTSGHFLRISCARIIAWQHE